MVNARACIICLYLGLYLAGILAPIAADTARLPANSIGMQLVEIKPGAFEKPYYNINGSLLR